MKRILITAGIILIIVFAVIFGKKSLKKTNSPPIAVSTTVKTQEEIPINITLKGQDPEGLVISYKVLSQPSHGTLEGSEPNLIYTPDKDFNGSDKIEFCVNDGVFDSNTAVFSILVTPLNDKPIAKDDEMEIQEDSAPVTIDVLQNDLDPDNDPLTVLNAAEASQGTTLINTDSRVTYTPNKNFSGTDTFTYTISDGEGGTDTAKVHIKIAKVNDAPIIRTRPLTATRVWGKYLYDVNATDSDTDDKLTYALVKSPAGMKINSTTGQIEWEPTSNQAGEHNVEVKVEDSNSIPASDSQSFVITVASLDAPLQENMNVENCYSSETKERLPKNEIAYIQQSNDKWIEIPGNTFVYFSFSDTSIPAGATIGSVVLNIEHYEDERFPAGKLQWNIGTNWFDKPDIWNSIDTPIHEGKENESSDSWDITSIVDSTEKLETFQLQINNTNNVKGQKTYIDNISIVINWY